MLNTLFAIYVVDDHQTTNSVVLAAFEKFSQQLTNQNHFWQLAKTILKPTQLADFVFQSAPMVIIFDNIPAAAIDHALIKKIKQLSPFTHFFYFCKTYDPNLFLAILQKEIEFCVSLDFFTEQLFAQTLANVFNKIYFLNRYNKAVVSANNITINLLNQKVWLNGSELYLSKTEFEITKLFVQHPNVTFSSKELLERVWGYREDNTALVSQYIYKIKKKLGKENFVSDKNGHCLKLRTLTLV